VDKIYCDICKIPIAPVGLDAGVSVKIGERYFCGDCKATAYASQPQEEVYAALLGDEEPPPPPRPTPKAKKSVTRKLDPERFRKEQEAEEFEITAIERKMDRWDEDQHPWARFKRSLKTMPAWMISLSVHMIVLIVMALMIYAVSTIKPPDEYTVYLGDEWRKMPPGEQPEQETPEDQPEDQAPDQTEPEPVDTPPDPNDTEQTPDSVAAADSSKQTTDSAEVNPIYANRLGDNKMLALKKYGGSEEGLKAVAGGLRWLSQHQGHSGTWDAQKYHEMCNDPGCIGLGSRKYSPGVTGLALLAFLGDGHTHLSGEYKDTVKRGLASIEQRMNAEGGIQNFTGRVDMYNHAISTFAVAEAYNLTRDPLLRKVLDRLVRYIYAAEQDEGGWDYEMKRVPTRRIDTSITGWTLLALDASQRAGVEVPEEIFDRIRKIIESRTDPRTGEVIYANLAPGNGRTGATMTAVGLLCRVYLGMEDRGPLIKGTRTVLNHLPNFSRFSASKELDINASYYCWYTAMLAFFHLQGTAWRTWNAAVLEQLLPHQATEGHASGSFPPDDDWPGQEGGRVYSTAMSVLMLETYYRYKPKYQRLGGTNLPDDLMLVGVKDGGEELDPIEYLRSMLGEDQERDIREYAVTELARIDGKEITDILLEQLDTRDTIFMNTVIQALGTREPEQVLPHFKEILEEGRSTKTSAVLRSMGQMRDKQVVYLMAPELENNNPAIRRAARDGLTTLAGRDLGETPEAWIAWVKNIEGEIPEQALPVDEPPDEDDENAVQLVQLKAELADDAANTRWEAIKKIAELGDPRGADLIVDALANEKGHLVPALIGCLGTLKAAKTVPLLIGYLDADDDRVLRATIKSLEKITGEAYGHDKVSWQKWYVENRDKLPK
jgi:HEAT repeat protein